MRPKRWRTGVIGLGRWGARLTRAVSARPSFELCKVCDLDVERTSTFETMARTYSSLTPDFFEDLAVVFVAVDPIVQAQIGLSALEAGCHLFLEKPAALRGVDAARLLSCAERCGLALFVDHLPLFSPAHRRARQLVEAGTLGELRSIWAIRTGGRAWPGVSRLWTMASHDVALVQSLLPGRELTFTLIEGGPGGLNLHFDGSPNVTIAVGADSAPQRRMVIAGTRAILFVDESTSLVRLLNENSSSDLLFGLPSAVSLQIVEALSIAPARECWQMDGDALRRALDEFEQLVCASPHERQLDPAFAKVVESLERAEARSD